MRSPDRTQTNINGSRSSTLLHTRAGAQHPHSILLLKAHSVASDARGKHAGIFIERGQAHYALHIRVLSTDVGPQQVHHMPKYAAEPSNDATASCSLHSALKAQATSTQRPPRPPLLVAF